jgi:CheY-like chemotaxis protein
LQPSSRRILVVDDNVDAAESVVLILGLSGHQVRMAHTGPEALQVAAEFRPDVIVLDIGLPGINGYEVARRLRQEPAQANVLLIAMTGYGQEDDRRRSSEVGFDHHLVKPVDPEVLANLVAEHRSRDR